MAEPSEMPFEVWILWAQMLDGGPDPPRQGAIFNDTVTDGFVDWYFMVLSTPASFTVCAYRVETEVVTTDIMQLHQT